MTLRATFQRLTLTDTPLPRSSHSFSIIDGNGLLFGGEIEPRKPVQPAVYSFPLDSASQHPLQYITSPPNESSPSARVGHVSAKLGDAFYIFGGRGGKDEAKPMEESGRVWRYASTGKQWTALDPSSSIYPSARSYHAATAAEDLGKLFIHAGCPASGRTGDLWSFDVADKAWTELPSAPEPPRGGPGFAYALGHLYRYGGFDGRNEQGGKLDYLDVSQHSQTWKSIGFDEGKHPGGRSVTGLQVVKIGGKHFLIAFLGERDASSQGHAGAGKFWDDVWSLALSSDGRPVDGWSHCDLTAQSDKPPARGWFASDVLGDDKVVVYGGLNGMNVRESDVYFIKLEKAK